MSVAHSIVCHWIETFDKDGEYANMHKVNKHRRYCALIATVNGDVGRLEQLTKLSATDLQRAMDMAKFMLDLSTERLPMPDLSSPHRIPVMHRITQYMSERRAQADVDAEMIKYLSKRMKCEKI